MQALKQQWGVFCLCFSLLAFGLSACSFQKTEKSENLIKPASHGASKEKAKGSKRKKLLINGAGASFPYILYSKWIMEYRKKQTHIAINYQSIGSGGGIRQFISGALDFGGTDVPVSKEDIQSSHKEIVYIPTTLGAVAVTYNLPFKAQTALKMDGSVLSKIFMGEIKTWDDARIKKLNPKAPLPAKDIVVVYRADGSGTTAFFTDYLCRLSKDFGQKVGQGKLVSWPIGVGGKGNEGVMGLVSKIEGAIAYIGASYAGSQKLPTIAVKNKAGRFKQPDSMAVRAAARQAVKTKKTSSSMIYIGGQNSYPIAGFSYIIISKKMPREKGQALADFLKWALSPEGQKLAEPLYFIPLPKTVTNFAMKNLSQVEFE